MTQEQIDRERYERLAAARVPVPPYGIDTGWAAGIAAVIAALIMAGIAFADRNIELTNRLADSGGQRTERDDGLRDRASSSERAMERGGSSFSG